MKKESKEAKDLTQKRWVPDTEMVIKGWIAYYSFRLDLLIQKKNPERKKRAEKDNTAEKLVVSYEEIIRILNSYC